MIEYCELEAGNRAIRPRIQFWVEWRDSQFLTGNIRSSRGPISTNSFILLILTLFGSAIAEWSRMGMAPFDPEFNSGWNGAILSF